MPHLMKLSSERLTMILDQSRDSVFVTDGEGTVLFVNPVAEGLLGFPAVELEGKNIKALLAGDYYQNSAVLKAMESGKIETETIFYRSGLAGVSTSVPVLDASGRIELIITSSSGEERIRQLQLSIEQDQRVLKRYQREVEHLRQKRHAHIVAESPAMRKVLQAASLIARVDLPVMLIGDTGVGKDVVANYIHSESDRRDHTFVDINCAAIPDTLLEAELFGYERGAFTGAGNRGKMGLFELANGGVLFLDEVAELPLPLQAKLLKVLESGCFRRLGGTEKIRSDVRVICATNRNLEEMVHNSAFRADLYYRLNVFRLDLLPLRERKEDILPLAELFLSQQNEKYGMKKRLSDRFRRELTEYAWPGNIRELRNVISRAYFLADGDMLEGEPLGRQSQPQDWPQPGAGSQPPSQPFGGTLREYRNRAEIAYITYVLKKHGGKMDAAAQELGITRSQIYRILKRERSAQEPPAQTQPEEDRRHVY